MAALQLLPATPRDAADLSKFGRRSFVETFVEDLGVPYPEADLATFFDEGFTEAAFAGLIADRDAAVWIARRDGQVCAYAVGGPLSLPHPEGRARERELKRFYLARDLQGSGAATTMMSAVAPWLAPFPAARIWLGVWSGNLRAQRFYARHGFHKVGEYEYPVGATRDLEFIMRRDGDPSALTGGKLARRA